MIAAAEGQQVLEVEAYWERPTSAADCFHVPLEHGVFHSAFDDGLAVEPAAAAAAAGVAAAAEVAAIAAEIAVPVQAVVGSVPGKRQEAPGCLQAVGMW